MANAISVWATSLMLLALSAATYASDVQIEYQVPAGFSESEQDKSMQFLATLDGMPLPGPVSWSAQKNQLTFNEKLYSENNISAEQIATLNKVLPQIPFVVCQNGCDFTLSGQTVSLDKIKRSLTINDGSKNYVQPVTMFSFIHNQSLDLRASSEEYRAVSAFGQGYLGLPAQSYGYLGWHYSQNRNYSAHSTDHGISTWYLQKNFASTYLRSGRQDSRDAAAGSVNTSLNPSFDQFVTLGSQENLKQEKASAGKLVLFATSDGDYEFYREGRLIRRVPAVIGRNEIDYNQLPGGFYSVEIRLVNRNGQVLSRENQQIANVNYGTGSGWFLTMGKELYTEQNIVNAGASFQNTWFAASSSLLKGSGSTWAIENNITRPMLIGNLNITPTVGMMTGEKTTGGYASLSASNPMMGSLTLSQYQNTSVSEFYQASNSTSFFYSRQFGPTRLSYNYSRYNHSELHQMQSTWNARGSGVWAVISAGLQKGGYNYSGNNFGVFLNTTIMLDHSNATVNAAYENGKLHTGGSYTRDFEDNTGTTYTGVDFSEVGRTNAFGVNARRSGTRGDASMRVGVEDHVSNGSFNYNGMVAGSKDGMALGRTSSGGAAMLVETPVLGDMSYGFKVEGHPVAGGSTYAVPLASYQDVVFASAQSVDTGTDMNIRLPANVVRAHPGQVYLVKAEVEMNLLYNGFLVDSFGKPISGTVKETGDRVYPNGLFSVTSSTLLKHIIVDDTQRRYRCDLTQPKDNRYICVAG